MNTLLLLPLAATLAAVFSTHAPAPAPASDPSGIYALIEKVVFLPDEAKPERIELHGAFAIAVGQHGDYYTGPRWGRLLLRAPEQKTEACIAQWRDLARVAGTRQVVAFSSRYSQKDVRVLGPDATAGTPGVQGMDFGVNKVENSRWGSAQGLKLLPKPIAPVTVGPNATDEGQYNSYPIEFQVTNGATDGDVRYVFEVETARERVASQPITPGETTTSWKTNVFLVAGDRVKWSVRVVGDKVERAPVAEATFVVGKEIDDGTRRRR